MAELCITAIVSHDSNFLNNTITNALHRRYHGNLEKFAQQIPEAKSYHALEAVEDYKLKLPDPPLLEGVKTKEKSLLKMQVLELYAPNETDPYHSQV